MDVVEREHHNSETHRGYKGVDNPAATEGNQLVPRVFYIFSYKIRIVQRTKNYSIILIELGGYSDLILNRRLIDLKIPLLFFTDDGSTLRPDLVISVQPQQGK